LSAGAERVSPERRPVAAVFTSHWLAMVGLGLILTAIIAWGCLITVKLRTGEENPYIGVASLIIGGVLIVGAILTPLGLHLGRRRLETTLSSLMHDHRRAWRRPPSGRRAPWRRGRRGRGACS